MNVQANSQSTDALTSLLAEVGQLISSAESSSPQAAGAGTPGSGPSSLMPATPSQDQFSSGSQNPMQALGLILEGLGELMSMIDQGQNGTSTPQASSGGPTPQSQSTGQAPAGDGTGGTQGSGFAFAVPGFSYQDGGSNGGFNVSTPGLSFGSN